MDLLGYKEQLGINVCDNEKFEYFLKILFNELEKGLNIPSAQYICRDDYLAFCNLVGVQADYSILGKDIMSELLDSGTGKKDRKRFYHCLSILKEHTADLKDFLVYYISFVNSINTENKKINIYFYRRKDYAEFIKNALEKAHIPLKLIIDEGEYFVFPKGASELDNSLVSQTLEWLSSFPKSHIAFAKALRAYSGAMPDNASDIADKFRKALETFFQEFFGGARSLEKYVSDHTYERYLNNCGVPSDMRDEFKNTINAYTKFINNNAKHHDKTELKVLEYLMYQTGNIIRLLITLRQEEQTDAH